MLLGYGAKVGLGNMRVKAENRMVTNQVLFRKRQRIRHIKFDQLFPSINQCNVFNSVTLISNKNFILTI